MCACLIGRLQLFCRADTLSIKEKERDVRLTHRQTAAVFAKQIL